jgi:hypothetical protein
MDDIAATGKSLSDNVARFCGENGSLLHDIPVHVITLVATRAAQSSILAKIQDITEADVEFRTCEILEDDAYAFPESIKIWTSSEDELRAKALCADLGSKIYRPYPMGYGGMGLLVVFPTTVPNNTLPILHSHSRDGADPRWVPLFPRVVN